MAIIRLLADPRYVPIPSVSIADIGKDITIGLSLSDRATPMNWGRERPPGFSLLVAPRATRRVVHAPLVAVTLCGVAASIALVTRSRVRVRIPTVRSPQYAVTTHRGRLSSRALS
jgi:hypothetical protein